MVTSPVIDLNDRLFCSSKNPAFSATISVRNIYYTSRIAQDLHVKSDEDLGGGSINRNREKNIKFY